MQKLLKRSEVEERIGKSRAWLYKRCRSGQFPAPIKIIGEGKRPSNAWLESEVNAWITAQIEKSRGGRQ